MIEPLNKIRTKKEVKSKYFLKYSLKNIFNFFIFFKKSFYNLFFKKGMKSKYKFISVKKLLSSKEKYSIIDLRNRDDFFKDHIVIDRLGISMNIPFDDIYNKIKEIERFRLKNFLIYSDNDDKSIKAAEILSLKGFNITILRGGYKKYKLEMFNN